MSHHSITTTTLLCVDHTGLGKLMSVTAPTITLPGLTEQFWNILQHILYFHTAFKFLVSLCVIFFKQTAQKFYNNFLNSFLYGLKFVSKMTANAQRVIYKYALSCTCVLQSTNTNFLFVTCVLVSTNMCICKYIIFYL